MPVRRVRSVSSSASSTSSTETPSVISEREQRVRVPTHRRRQARQEAMRRQPARQRANYEEDYDDNKPTPLLFKILMCIGLILLFFVSGYLGASWIVDFFSKKLLLKPEDRIENQEDLSRFQDSEHQRVTQDALRASEGVPQVVINLYHVRDDSIAETQKNFISRTPEDNIRDALTELLSLSEVPNAEKIKLLHVFRDDDTAFLDMSGQFIPALDAMGQRKSQLLLTGIVRTLQENFSPVSQVRFLIDSKPPKSGGTVELGRVWRMPKKTS
ncbi:MAG: GerMN domain-containing protein [Synergistaceae bacterium]|nr:GerMN domain-containing protein [Synergistaceae bacterium]MBQ3693947.1 GerMN domain-containing protein [Synergistaceae bacterium]MBQ9629600.1 GerMN domain-containing protein [Synergistaceae bacterium]MBR0250132.1 GerMN domain-containing protein [Synergistaceae bacterium]